MGDENASKPEPGFVSFRAARALAGNGAGTERVPPPLPPPPPGVAAPAGTPSAPAGPVVPAAAARPAAVRPERPPLPAPGTSAQEAWSSLVAWCASAGVADAGLVSDGGGTVLAARGELPPGVPGELLERLSGALVAARRSAGGAPSAAAVDVGGRWLTAFPVAVPGQGDLVAVLAGTAPMRPAIRAALAGWLRDALYRP
jgi:hypothetical protein